MHIFGFDLTLWQAVVLVVVAFLLGFSKTGVIGLGVVMTPLLVSAFPTGLSLGFVVPLSLLGDSLAIAKYRHKVVLRPLLKALPWGIAGTLFGWQIAAALARAYGPAADGKLRVLIGFLMLSVVLLGFYIARHPRMAMAQKTPEGAPRVRSWYAASLGSFAGIVGMLTNSGGTIWGVYFSSLGLEVKEIIGTVVWCYAIIALVKMPLSANLGFLTLNSIYLNLALTPIVVAGVLVGPSFSSRFDKAKFGTLTRTCALLGSLYMILF